MFQFKRLNPIRQRLGLTLNEVYERTRIGMSSLSDFENGKREPSLGQLQKLASLYEKSLSFFFEDVLPMEGVLLWREKPAPPASDRIQARFDKLCRQYHNLESWTKTPAVDSFKKLFSDSFPVDYREVERLAHEVWQKMGLGERPGESLLRVLEEVYGVKVFHLDLGSETSSACTYGDEYGPAILLNRSSKPWRRNFDLAHELFHLITWKSRKTKQANQEAPSEQEERFANMFASRLLLPDEPFRDAIQSIIDPNDKITYDDLDSVARQFGVSLDALFWRLSSLYRVLSNTIPKMIEEAKLFSQLPTRPDEFPLELPCRYRALAAKALRHGEISSAQFANYLGIGVADVDDYTSSHEPEPIQITAHNP